MYSYPEGETLVEGHHLYETPWTVASPDGSLLTWYPTYRPILPIAGSR
jgi:hypothetical protein